MWNKPCWKLRSEGLGDRPPVQEEHRHTDTAPGTCTEQPHDALRPFGTDKHFSWSAITYFCLEQDFPSKAAPESVLIQPSLKASSCRHSSVDSCTDFLLLPYLWHLICNFCWVFSFFFSPPLFSSECSRSSCCSGFSSSHDFWSAWVQAKKTQPWL